MDIHRHLEGSLRLSTIIEIAREEGIPLPSYDLDKLRRYFQVIDDEEPDFQLFLSKFRFLRRVYSTREAIQRIAYEAVVDAARDNVRYLELRFNPVALAQSQGFPLNQVSDWVFEAASKAASERGIQVNFIITITRDMDVGTARKLVRLALNNRNRGVVGLDLAGDEVNYPAYPLVPLFREARRRGLGITIHAGEVTGAERVYEAVEILGANRIGHGVKSTQDLNVLDLLKFKRVVLEMCLTSNIQTGAVRELESHPLLALYRLGVIVTLNSDDPGVSNTTLTDEYLLALRGLKLSQEELTDIICNGILGSFLPVGEKIELLKEFKRELKQLHMPFFPEQKEVLQWL